MTTRGAVPAYEAELRKIYDAAVERQREFIANDIEDAVRQGYSAAVLDALGIERRGWTDSIQFTYKGQQKIKEEVEATAAEVVAGLKWDDPKFSPVEQERIRKAYRGAFITACVEAAKEAAARDADRLVREVTGG